MDTWGKAGFSKRESQDGKMVTSLMKTGTVACEPTGGYALVKVLHALIGLVHWYKQKTYVVTRAWTEDTIVKIELARVETGDNFVSSWYPEEAIWQEESGEV